MNTLTNIFLLAAGFSFLIGAVINSLNITNDEKINKIHIDYIRVSLVFSVISLILYLIK